METLHYFINLVLHLDQNLITFVNFYGSWAYAILFLIIFCETGLVVTPFLPGDSLLFAAGSLTASADHGFNIHFLCILLVTASVLGNLVNYCLGRFLGPRVFHYSHSRFLNPQYLVKAHHFYEQHGGKALIIARFMPIVRTFAPFVAGVGYMPLARFMIYNLCGALLWIGSLLYSSYLFGNLPFIKEHFSTVILLVIAGSLIPAVLGYWRTSST
jgi:membrane-associated protein